MTTYSLLDLEDVIRSLGRGVVLRAPEWAPGDGPLDMAHLADTEGDIVINTNAEMAKLTTPELTGPAAREIDYTGEDPVLEIPMYLADPATRALVSPTGTTSAGRTRRSAPVFHTIAIFPEALFVKNDGSGLPTSYDLTLTAGVWALAGTPLTTAQLTLLDTAFWLWRGVFTRPPMTWHGGAGDERKQIETASLMGIHHPGMPNGHHLYTVGDPTTQGIDIETGS